MTASALVAGRFFGVPLVEEMSGGRVRLGTGTLYTALDRLTAEGFIELVSEEMISGRVRRSYGLTDAGGAVLRAEARRMAEAARLVTGNAAGARAARPGWQARTA